jgi:hypothetical protein
MSLSSLSFSPVTFKAAALQRVAADNLLLAAIEKLHEAAIEPPSADDFTESAGEVLALRIVAPAIAIYLYARHVTVLAFAYWSVSFLSGASFL